MALRNNLHSHNILLTLVLALLLTSSGCEQPTVVMDRNNMNDPTHPEYVPGSPQNLTITSDESGLVFLSWDDDAVLEDGFLVEKALGDTSSFEILEQLPPDTESFTDSSRTVDLNTFYRVSSYTQQGERLKRFDPIIAKLTIFKLKNTSLTEEPENRRYVLNWEIESDFLNSIELEISQKDESQPITLENNLDLIGSFEDNLDGIRFSDRIYVLRGNLGNDGNQQIAFEKTFTIDIDELYSPTSAYVDIVNEMELSVNWTNRAFFADAIELYKRDQSGDYNLLDTLDPETTKYTDFSPVMERNTYHIISVVGDSKSTFEPATKPFQWQSIPTATISDASLAIPDYLELSLSAEPADIVDEFILFRSNHQTNEKTEIARLPAESASYRDYQIESGLKYSYTLESSSTLALSQKSDMNDVEIVLTDRFDKTKVYDLDFCGSTRPHDNLRLINNRQYALLRAGKCGNSGEKLKIVNLITNEVHELVFPGINYINDYFYNPFLNTLSAFFANKMTEMTFPDGAVVREVDNLLSLSEYNRFYPVRNVELHSNGADIYANTNNGSILKFDLETLDLNTIRKGGGSSIGPRDIQLSNDERVLVSNDRVNYVVNPDQNNIIQTFGDPISQYLPERTFFSADDSYFYEIRRTRGLNIYSSNWSKITNPLDELFIDGDSHPSNSSVIGGFGKSSFIIYDLALDKYTHIRKIESLYPDLIFQTISGFRFIDDSSYIVSRRDDILEIWEKTNQKSWVVLVD